ncbi:cation diffusion facilitator family transporter [Aliivibrio kagoshimensis]|uniref:cation diffusion facilitator family transporter n=1 Tax=Aliivibrio kagoshimensis TaxID=2910230 RepID=UPI003D0F2523
MSEKNTILLSIYATSIFAVLGVGWGIYASSGMIIFDGIYSLISVGLSSLALVVLKQLETSQEDDRFPFGKAHFEPLLIIFKSLMLIGMCSYSAINSFGELFSGGREVATGSALLYALFSTLACLVITMIIGKNNQKIGSDLLLAEKNQWMGDTLLSIGVLVGFSVAYLLEGSAYNAVVPYADPAMVVLASTLFIIIPLKSFIAAAKEMVFYQSSHPNLETIEKTAQKIADELHAEYKIRMVNIGRELSIEVNFLLAERQFLVSEMDAIRNRIADQATAIDKEHWINVSFTQQKVWL